MTSMSHFRSILSRTLPAVTLNNPPFVPLMIPFMWRTPPPPGWLKLLVRVTLTGTTDHQPDALHDYSRGRLTYLEKFSLFWQVRMETSCTWIYTYPGVVRQLFILLLFSSWKLFSHLLNHDTLLRCCSLLCEFKLLSMILIFEWFLITPSQRILLVGYDLTMWQCQWKSLFLDLGLLSLTLLQKLLNRVVE